MTTASTENTDCASAIEYISQEISIQYPQYLTLATKFKEKCIQEEFEEIEILIDDFAAGFDESVLLEVIHKELDIKPEDKEQMCKFIHGLLVAYNSSPSDAITLNSGTYDLLNHATKISIQQIYSIGIGEIMHSQQRLFDGYIRIQILSQLSDDTLRTTPAAVIQLCNSFYTILIISSMELCREELLKVEDFEWMKDEENKDDADTFALQHVCYKLAANEEYWLEYEILQLLLKYDKDEEQHVVYYKMLGGALDLWAFIQGFDMQKPDVTHLQNEAIAAYQQAIELEPKDLELRREFTRCLSKAYKNELVISQILEIMELDSKDEFKIWALSHIGSSYDVQGDVENAKKYWQLEADEYQKVLDSDPTNYGMRERLAGSFRFRLKKYQSAIGEYLKLLDHEKCVRKADVCGHIACCHEKLQDYETAENYYKKAMELEPNSEWHLAASAKFSWNCLKNYQQSKMYYDKIIELKPKRIFRIRQCADMMRDAKRYKESEKYYLTALEIDEWNSGINTQYGYLLYLMGDFEKALKYIEIAIKYGGYTNHWDYFYHALVNQQLDNKDKAEESLSKAVEWSKSAFPTKVLLMRRVTKHLTEMKEDDPYDNMLYDRFSELSVPRSTE